MKKFLLILLAAGFVGCNNSSDAGKELDSAKKKIDTALTRIENSETMDSIKAKGGRIWDTARSKTEKLIDKTKDKLKEFKKKDSLK